jgi:peptidoglycan-associated lipoprotein
MKLFRKIALFTLLAHTSLAFGQKSAAKDAEAAFRNEQYFTAKDLFYKAAQEEKKNMNKKGYYYFMSGECCRFILDPKSAEERYKAAIEAKYSNPEVYLRLAEMQKEQENYKEAEKNFRTYKEKGGDARGEKGEQSCKLAQELIKNKTRHIIENEQILNTQYYDFSPVISSKKGDEMIFSSSRPGGLGTKTDERTGQTYTDLWVTNKDKKGKWLEPTSLPQGINSDVNEGAAVFDSRYEMMYYTSCPLVKKKKLGCDIYYVERKSGRWGTAVKMNLKDHDSISVGHPALTNDDLTLIFASDMPGGLGGKDLWKVSYDKKNKTWGTPENLGPAINTPGDEMFPYIHSDGSLYFSSDGHLGLGGLDMFRATVVGNEKKWENPKNLGYPMNSAQHDFGIIFTAKDAGYFTSNRTGSKGQDDIYSFMLPPLLFKLNVTVLNAKTNEPFPDINIRLTGNDNSDVTLKTDANGKVIFEVTPDQKRYINENTSYKVEAIATKDMIKVGDLTAQFTTVGEEKSKEWNYVFKIKPVEKGPLCLPIIVYAYDRWELMVDPTGTLKGNDFKRPLNSEDSLLYLYDLLVENPTFVIQLRAHTDTRGSDTYNQKLSQKRAESVVNFLASKGISKDRMVPIGMGKREPIIKDAEIKAMKTKEEQEAAHQVNRRTDFKILSTDYVLKDSEKNLKPTGLQWIKDMLENGCDRGKK